MSDSPQQSGVNIDDLKETIASFRRFGNLETFEALRDLSEAIIRVRSAIEFIEGDLEISERVEDHKALNFAFPIAYLESAIEDIQCALDRVTRQVVPSTIGAMALQKAKLVLGALRPETTEED